VISANLKRRHLDESQRAMSAGKLANMKQGERTDLPAIAGKSVSQDDASKLFNVSIDSLERAKRVLQTGAQSLIAAVEQGKIKVSAAASVANLDAPTRDNVTHKIVDLGLKSTEAIRQAKKEALPAKIAALPEGKYRVIYADPPYEYNDTRLTADRYKSTSALGHYSDEALEKLKKLDVKSIAAEDSVLFLWGTCPLMDDARELIDAWGFTYKTLFIWDKGHGCFGNYHDAEAELLFVATRGSCTPEADKREKQIQRFPRGKHSEKPEEFRALIDRLYPPHPPKIDRVELFRRGAVPDNWHTWGAEAVEEKAA
jgi:N6-adenosine-specific RNA methylase IME4